jgi:hypothetical protein
MPQPVNQSDTGTYSPWHVSKAKGTHSLLIAVFYNTPTFDQRKEVAEQYVEMLREDNVPAYFHHEVVKSYVYVGDFSESDVTATPDGQWRYSARLEQMVQSRPDDEFKYLTENGHLRKRRGPTGEMIAPPSRLVPVPRDAWGSQW